MFLLCHSGGYLSDVLLRGARRVFTAGIYFLGGTILLYSCSCDEFKKGGVSRKGVAPGRGRVLRCVGSRVLAENFPPTIHRVYRTIGLGSASSIRSRLRALRGGNCVEESPAGPHTVRVLSSGFGLAEERVIGVPVVNHITTNRPLLTRRGVRSCFPVPMRCVPGGRAFVLRMRNRDVVGTKVLDKSCIVIRRAPSTRGKRRMITLVRSNTAIGAFCHRRNVVHLRPRGSTCSPVVLASIAVLNGMVNIVHVCWVSLLSVKFLVEARDVGG